MDQEVESPTIRLHVIVACHNRRELTVRGIRAFAHACRLAGAAVDFTVFDDGSTDGTSEALAALRIPITCIAGDGSAFWSRSMAQAEAVTLRDYDDGCIVWLNDDVEVDADSIEVALAAVHSTPGAVLVGAMRDPDSGRLTYSAQRRSGFFPLEFVNIEPNGTLQAVPNMCGNLVFVPIEVARRLGGIDGEFAHGFADWDYGVRAIEAGFEIVLLPRTLGCCASNPTVPRGRVMADWRAFCSPKGGNDFRSMKRILQKWYPHSWLGYVLWRYLRWWLGRLRYSVGRLVHRG